MKDEFKNYGDKELNPEFMISPTCREFSGFYEAFMAGLSSDPATEIHLKRNSGTNTFSVLTDAEISLQRENRLGEMFFPAVKQPENSISVFQMDSFGRISGITNSRLVLQKSRTFRIDIDVGLAYLRRNTHCF